MMRLSGLGCSDRRRVGSCGKWAVGETAGTIASCDDLGVKAEISATAIATLQNVFPLTTDDCV